MSGAYLSQTDRDRAGSIADDVLGIPRPVRTSSRASVGDVVAEALAYRAALARRQSSHDEAEAAALSEPDPAPASEPTEPAPYVPPAALVPGHGITDRPGPDFDAIVAHAMGRH